MNVSCLQENFARALSIVTRAVPSRSTLPITQNVLLTTEQSMLKMSATNLEVAMTTWIGAQVHEEGAITVPARLLSEFVNTLPAERIDLSTTDQPIGVNIKCIPFESNISGASAADFPPLPTVDDGVVCRIDTQLLREAIRHVVFAAAVEDSRPVLTGVKTEINSDAFTFAAADGFRLAVYNGKLNEPVSEELDFLIPARTLNEISRLLSGQESPSVEFTVTPTNNQALFRLDGVEIYSTLINGSFPDYAQLIPQSHTTRAVTRASDFMSATRSAAIFARDGSGIIRLHILNVDEENPALNPNRINVSARAEEVGDNQGNILANIEGEDAKIAFNSKYLIDVLDVLSGGEVALEITSPSSPGVIKPNLAEDEEDNYVHVVMPMFVQW